MDYDNFLPVYAHRRRQLWPWVSKCQLLKMKKKLKFEKKKTKKKQGWVA